MGGVWEGFVYMGYPAFDVLLCEDWDRWVTGGWMARTLDTPGCWMKSVMVRFGAC